MANTFDKSRDNKATERTAGDLLLLDPRFQAPDTATRKAIIKGLALEGNFGSRSFDCVFTEKPIEKLTPENVGHYLPDLRLIEMKSTKKPIHDLSLSGFFFGATANEYDFAERLGDRFLFAFVILSNDNEYERPFAVLLTLSQLESRTKTKRVQYQVNLRTDIDPREETHELVVFDAVELPPA